MRDVQGPVLDLVYDLLARSAPAMFAAGPMDQFEIKRLVPLQLGQYDISLTNSALWMLIAVTAASLFFTLAVNSRAVVPGRMQSIAEMAYEFIAQMVRDSIGQEGLRFFPFVFTLFIFVLFANMFGIIPYAFTPTSHIIVTLTLAMIAISIVIIYGFYANGLGFLKLFAPSGVPGWLMPLMVLIEIISFISRPISLSVRLFANMLAGHTMLKVFAGFTVSIAGAGGVWSLGAIGPFTAAVGITMLEILVAFLQAYVFAILTCIYLNDAVHVGHH